MAAETKLKILACRRIYTGRNQLNHEYSIFEVDAAKLDGSLINEKLRAFVALPVGEIIDVTIERFVSDRHGRSFTLHPKKGEPSGDPARVAELLAQVAKLEERVSRLEASHADSPVAPVEGW